MSPMTERVASAPFSGNQLDRLSARREDRAWIELQRQSASARFVVLADGKICVEGTAPERRLSTFPPGHLPPSAEGTPVVFLGCSELTSWFAISAAAGIDPELAGGFEELRPLALELPPEETGIAATARHLFEWHRRHRFCSQCGHETQATSAGWKRLCPSCAAEHFPRTDPAVIMLPVHGDRCLLGRGRSWPEGRMSALAGFMEPGESIEQACAREMREEAGVIATSVRYAGSQPWPFPSSLMIGLIAEVDDTPAQADLEEIAEVRWFTRDEAGRLLDGTHETVQGPTPLGIAHALLELWVNQAW
jgi:NAD+ diphosphatase